MKLVLRIILISILGVSIIWLFTHQTLHYKNTRLIYPLSFDIKPGESLHELLSDLNDRELIRVPVLYKIYGRFRPSISQIKAGEYVLDSALSGYEILNKLKQGEIHYRKITIPEGDRLRDIFAQLTDSLGIPQDSLWTIEKHPEQIRELTGLDIVSLEGYLYPETYYFSKFQSPREVITAMTTLFKQRILPVWNHRPASFPFNLNESLTLASIIEKETSVRTEIRSVSSVYHNRLNQRMKLQACPTVQYILPHNKRLYEGDLLKPSPYNTYLNEGLPPAPICSPSLAAFEAALYPAKTEYLFFVAGTEGIHLFSRTFSEHSRKIAQIKKSRNEF